MNKDYVLLASIYYPNNPVSCLGDPSVYGNLSWLNGSVSQADLDAKFIQEYKIKKITEVDAKTVQLIGQGFNFDNETFSLSQAAQINWVGLKTLESLLSWPVSITTKSDDEYQLSQANLDSFIGAGKAVVQTNLDSGRQLKVQINAATTEAELDAIQDNR